MRAVPSLTTTYLFLNQLNLCSAGVKFPFSRGLIKKNNHRLMKKNNRLAKRPFLTPRSELNKSPLWQNVDFFTSLSDLRFQIEIWKLYLARLLTISYMYIYYMLPSLLFRFNWCRLNHYVKIRHWMPCPRESSIKAKMISSVSSAFSVHRRNMCETSLEPREKLDNEVCETLDAAMMVVADFASTLAKGNYHLRSV